MAQAMGTIIHGTMRSEDLIPAFLAILETSPDKRHQHNVKVIKANMEAEDYYESKESTWDLNEILWEGLNDMAPEGCYFGSHEGDGSDYGFWSEPLDFESDPYPIADRR